MAGTYYGGAVKSVFDILKEFGAKNVELQTTDDSGVIINSLTFHMNDNGKFDVNASIPSSVGYTTANSIITLLDSIEFNYDTINIQTDITRPEDIAYIADNLKSVNPSLIDIVSPNGDYIVGSALNDSLTGSEPRNVIIDPNTGEVLYSEGGNDTIYGNDGEDKINGGGGNDTLYGGDKKDTYIIDNNSGTDTIIDSDGQVYYKNYKLANAYKQADGTYKDTRGNVFNLSGDTLTVTNPAINSQVQINDFQNGNLGIHLHESSDMPVIGEDGAKVLVNVDGRSGPWDVNVNPSYSYGDNTNYLPPAIVLKAA